MKGREQTLFILKIPPHWFLIYTHTSTYIFPVTEEKKMKKKDTYLVEINV